MFSHTHSTTSGNTNEYQRTGNVFGDDEFEYRAVSYDSESRKIDGSFMAYG